MPISVNMLHTLLPPTPLFKGGEPLDLLQVLEKTVLPTSLLGNKFSANSSSKLKLNFSSVIPARMITLNQSHLQSAAEKQLYDGCSNRHDIRQDKV
jgi:hypothetical protein